MLNLRVRSLRAGNGRTLAASCRPPPALACAAPLPVNTHSRCAPRPALPLPPRRRASPRRLCCRSRRCRTTAWGRRTWCWHASPAAWRWAASLNILRFRVKEIDPSTGGWAGGQEGWGGGGGGGGGSWDGKWRQQGRAVPGGTPGGHAALPGVVTSAQQRVLLTTCACVFACRRGGGGGVRGRVPVGRCGGEEQGNRRRAPPQHQRRACVRAECVAGVDKNKAGGPSPAKSFPTPHPLSAACLPPSLLLRLPPTPAGGGGGLHQALLHPQLPHRLGRAARGQRDGGRLRHRAAGQPAGGESRMPFPANPEVAGTWDDVGLPASSCVSWPELKHAASDALIPPPFPCARPPPQDAVEAVGRILGMQACEGTDAVPPNARSHTLLLSGTVVGDVQASLGGAAAARPRSVCGRSSHCSSLTVPQACLPSLLIMPCHLPPCLRPVAGARAAGLWHRRAAKRGHEAGGAQRERGSVGGDTRNHPGGMRRSTARRL